MPAIETLRGYVNTWDCDENDHLNVQFYFRFFEDASAHFQRLCGLGQSARERPLVRHVRYHKELRSNDAIRIESFAAAGSGGREVVHMMYAAPAGTLAATCLETFADDAAGSVSVLSRHDMDLPDVARPRSVAPGPVEVGQGDDAALGRLTLASCIEGGDCGPDGLMRDWPIIGRNSDSAAHFWDLVGIDRAWLEAHGRGRVAVEMKLCRLADVRLGDLMHVVSRPIAIARSTVSFENRFVLSDSGEVAAVVQLTALTMNLTTRRAEPFPDETRALIERRIAEWQ